MKLRLKPEELSAPYELIGRWTDTSGDIVADGRETPSDDVEIVLDANSEFEHYWRAVSDLSLLDPWRAKFIYDEFVAASSGPGDAIECGVYRGGTSLLIGLVIKLRRPSKRIYMCDTFAGLPKPDRRVDRAYEEGAMKHSVAQVRKHIKELQLGEICVLRKGLFSTTFPGFSPDQTFCFAHIDCDLYAGAAESLSFLYPRMTSGGVIVVDDYGDESHGVMRAVNELAARTGLVVRLATPPQAFLAMEDTKKPKGADVFEVEMEGLKFRMSLGRLRSHAGFRDLWSQTMSLWRTRLKLMEKFSDVVYGDADKRR